KQARYQTALYPADGTNNTICNGRLPRRASMAKGRALSSQVAGLSTRAAVKDDSSAVIPQTIAFRAAATVFR
ncbi:MAG: hypothetical protein ACMG50_07825, partial [Thermomonas sp.]